MWIRNIQTTGKAFSPQKRTSSTFKLEISLFFIFLWDVFALIDPDPAKQNQCGSASEKLVVRCEDATEPVKVEVGSPPGVDGTR
jgi:hypothetical protein